MDEDSSSDFETDDIADFEPKKFDEKDFNKRLNQQKLSKHELDEMFLMD